MKQFVHWCKGNPILVVAGLIALASVVIIIVVTMIGSGFEEE